MSVSTFSHYHVWYLLSVLAPEAKTLLDAEGPMPELAEAWGSWYTRLDETLTRAFPVQVSERERQLRARIRRETKAVLRHEAGEKIDLSHLPMHHPDHPDYSLPF